MTGIPYPDQRDVLFEITHGHRLEGAVPTMQQVAPLERATLMLNRQQIDVLRAAHRTIAALAECPEDAVQRFLGSRGRWL